MKARFTADAAHGVSKTGPIAHIDFAKAIDFLVDLFPNSLAIFFQI